MRVLIKSADIKVQCEILSWVICTRVRYVILYVLDTRYHSFWGKYRICEVRSPSLTVILGAPPVSISEGNVNSVSEILGVVRVEFFEPVFPFSRDHGFTGIRAKSFFSSRR